MPGHHRGALLAGALAASLLAVGCLRTPSPERNFVLLESDPGDPVGGGRTFVYTQADAYLRVSATGNHLTVEVSGNEIWGGDFQLPSSVAELAPGSYAGLQRFPFHDPASGGLAWGGPGLFCNVLSGSIEVDAVRIVEGALRAIDLRFEQRCDGGEPALHGKIHWDADDPTRPPGPVNPPPGGLWEPAPGSTPATGSYLHLESDVGDPVGGGRSYTYTKADAVLQLLAWDGFFMFTVDGDEEWSGDFQAMVGQSALQPGYYGGLGRHDFHDLARGGIDWLGPMGGCSDLTGWLIVDAVVYDAGALTAFDARFEQRCDGAAGALHGEIRWRADDPTVPPGPVAPPAGLWEPVAGSTPATGSYILLESEAGDPVGAGQTYTYTPSDAVLYVAAEWGDLFLGVTGSESWSGRFRAMSSVSALLPGYYGDLERPFDNPAHGGLEWSGTLHTCGWVESWFVVDGVTYDAGALTALDARFEQRCDGAAAALHGQIHWTAP
jgi:hypothetical protein